MSRVFDIINIEFHQNTYFHQIEKGTKQYGYSIINADN
jgi:hypothetical protein